MALVGEYLGECIESPIVVNSSIAVLVALLMSLHHHLPLTQITNHNSSLNQFVSNEMRSFVQRIPLLIAFFLRNALVDLREINISFRLLCTFVSLRAKFIQLFVVLMKALLDHN